MKASIQELERADEILQSSGVDYGFDEGVTPDLRLMLVCSQRRLAQELLGRRHAVELTPERSPTTIAVLGEKTLEGVKSQIIYDLSRVTEKLIDDFMRRKDV